MINSPNNNCRTIRLSVFFSILLLCLPLTAFAGDPIPGIDITVDQSPPGIKKQGTTNANGEVILSGFKPGQCVVTIAHGGKLAVIGNQAKDRIIVPGKGKAGNIKPIRLELSSYLAPGSSMSKKGYDAYQARSNNSAAARGSEVTDRKRPGGTLKKDARDGALDGADGSSNQRANHNTTRSNRLAPKALDTDDDGDSIPATRAQDYNSSRSNITAARNLDRDLDNGMDDDCDSMVEILPMPDGRIKITVTCAG